MDQQVSLRESNKRERGIALLLVVFSLLLLSVIGLGMMYSTNMETAINSNYRDKQSALYAAIAGLQEARERIRYPYSITPPSTLPATGSHSVLYVVADGSAVLPWNNSNKYFDTELCHENVLTSIITAAAAGIPCPGPYNGGSSWYTAFDDSLSASAPWNLSYPLDLKWVRIQLKANNNTPVAVDGDSTNGAQACWDGAHQISTPSTYTTGCQPIGGVVSVSMITSGGGYSSAGPSVTFTGGGGSGASGTAVMAQESTGYVVSIAVTTGGSGYTGIPDVIISSPGNHGVTATATAVTGGAATTITGGIVTAVNLSNGGSYTPGTWTGTSWSNPPTVVFGGPGSGATANVSIATNTTSGSVTSVTMTTGGSGYTVAPTVGFSGSGGATATATLSTTGSVITQVFNVSSAGDYCFTKSGDHVYDPPVISFSGGGGSGAVATGVLEATRSCVHDITVNTSPKCTNKLVAPTYSPADQKSGVSLQVGNKSFSGTLYVSTGSSPADDKTPTSMTVQLPGYDATNYATNPINNAAIQLTGGAFTDCANVTVNVYTGYRLAGINVTNGGGGYGSDPTVTITGGIGATAPTVTVSRAFPVASVTVTNGGAGYVTAPTVTFTPVNGAGSGALATASLGHTYYVSAVNVTSGGSGYTSTPSVTFNCVSPCNGSGAAGTATVATTSQSTFSIASVTVNNGGSGYDPNNPPTVTICQPNSGCNNAGGSGATATVTIGTQGTGTYYVLGVNLSLGANGYSGSGYTSNPTVTFCGTDTAGVNGCPSNSGPGSGAIGLAQVSGGTKFGQVYLLTSFAQTKTGARAMVQQEVATPVLGFALGGALTLDGPNPVLPQLASSQNFLIQGQDTNSCNQTKDKDHPAVDGYDDPNANPPTNSVQTIISTLPKPDNITGSGGTPSVQNGYASLGETMTTPDGLYGLLGSFLQPGLGAKYYNNSTVNTFNPLSTIQSSITYIDGDVTLGQSGQTNNGCQIPAGYTNKDAGCGILVVTGTLTMSGNFSWYGLILVVGDGVMSYSGGGNGNIVGSIIESKIWNSSSTSDCPGPQNVDAAQGTRYLCNQVQSPTMTWNGGGGNGIFFDHCWSTNLMTAIPFTPPPSTRPPKILSMRILPY